jgi:hypothetical protein
MSYSSGGLFVYVVFGGLKMVLLGLEFFVVFVFGCICVVHITTTV